VTTALITGISGQDGSYLTELLLTKGYRVAGITRDVSAAVLGPIGLAGTAVELFEAQPGDTEALHRIIVEVMPDEVYNLAGQSHVGGSWKDPVGTAEATALAAAKLLETVRELRPGARLFQASSSEVFAVDAPMPLSEESTMRPASLYGAAKLYAHHMTRIYREAFGLYAANGILFNHESPRRGESFVTQRIARGVARIARGKQKELRLGNLEPRRDWGFAGDYARAMWLMLQRPVAEDLVIGTGKAHSVREFCEAAFRTAGLDWTEHVVFDESLIRPSDPSLRVADPSRARALLGWEPEIDFEALVQMMVHEAMRRET
jgi:GDPmannose 4,6-dehydratase